MRRAGWIGGIGTALTVIVLGGAASGSEPPDSRLNPASGHVETTDSYLGAGGFDVRHVEDRGPGLGRTVTVLSEAPEPDLAPRLGIATTGETWVAWWRNEGVPSIRLRRRGTDGAWGAEAALSEPGEDSRGPVVAVLGPDAWVAWTLPGPGGTGIAVRRVGDVPDPVGRILIGQAPAGGPADLSIQAESGRVWATWAGEGGGLAWSRRDPATGAWSDPALEPAPDGREAAWQRVRAQVLGP